MLKTGKSAGKGKAQQAPPPPKPRSDSTNADHPDYSCLIRATFNGQKISSVVSEFILALIYIVDPNTGTSPVQWGSEIPTSLDFEWSKKTILQRKIKWQSKQEQYRKRLILLLGEKYHRALLYMI